MGFNPFKSKKTVNVSSVVYNLAGEDYALRPNYLKSTIYSAIMQQDNTGNTVGQSIQNSYIHGSAIKYKSWYRYVRDNLYTYVNLPTSSINSSVDVLPEDILKQITVPTGKSAWVQTAVKDIANYMWWAEKYVIENHPDKYNLNWTADYISSTSTLSILFPDGSNAQTVLTDFDSKASYVYALYTLTDNNVVGDIIYGDTTIDAVEQPSIEGYTKVSSTSTSITNTLNTKTTVVKVYKDGSPTYTNTTNTSTQSTGTNTYTVYNKNTYLGQSTESDSISSRRDILNIWQNNKVYTDTTSTTETKYETVNGKQVEVEVTTKVEQDKVHYLYDSRLDTQTTTYLALESSNIFIYKLGNGEYLDKYISTQGKFGQFFPILPIRVDNVFINEIGKTSLWDKSIYYGEIAKAYKKLIGSDFADLIMSVAKNDSIDDIDYACINFGVPLNTKTNLSRQYIYTFFKELITYQTSSESDYLAWKAKAIVQANYQAKWNAWKEAQSDSTNPLYNTTEPIKGSISKPATSSIDIQTDKSWNSWYHINISWSYIAETTHTGRVSDSTKNGDITLSITKGDSLLVDMYLASIGSDSSDAVDLSDDVLSITWQKTDTEYVKLDIAGLVHKNIIYQGKSVNTTAKDALADTNESGFIIPLHYGILNNTQMVPATQLTSECAFITFNCYQVSKKRWYSTGWFRVVVIIAVIIITIYTGGVGASAAGVLGTNAAVGTALGATGTAAIVAGAAANSLAALAISTVLTRTAVAVLGKEVGTIVGAIASIAAMNIAATGSIAQGMSAAWNNIATAPNLLQMTQAVQTSYNAYAQDKLTDMQNELSNIEKTYTEKKDEITSLTEQLLGTSGLDINTQMFTESPDTFFNRTLLTGSDIASISHDMITNFVSMSNDLDNLKST